MKVIPIIILVISLVQCKSIQTETKPPFQIEESSYYDWFGGVEGASGYKLVIRLKSKKKVIFDSVFFQKKSTKLELVNNNDNILLVGHFSFNKPTIILHSDAKKEVNNKPPIKKIPFVLKDDEAIISYIEEGKKKKYYKIKSVKKTKSVHYPSAPNQKKIIILKNNN